MVKTYLSTIFTVKHDTHKKVTVVMITIITKKIYNNKKKTTTTTKQMGLLLHKSMLTMTTFPGTIVIVKKTN